MSISTCESQMAVENDPIRPKRFLFLWLYQPTLSVCYLTAMPEESRNCLLSISLLFEIGSALLKF